MQIAGAEVWPKTSFRILIVSLFFLAACFAQAPAPASAPPASSSAPHGYLDPLPPDTGAAGLKQTLRRLQNTGRLMMVVAHPDDEDGGLLTLESRGKGVHCLLMTLTRGEGGQNETGDTFSDELGILRTLELLAADRYYGVDQRFSRVADFGYSKTAEETFQKWGGHDVPLADIVRVIREFRPDVLIARFSGTNRDGHGHHQASSILAQEAFRAAADPNRFPEQIKEGLQPWQPKKLYVGNVCGFMSNACPDENWTVKLNTGEEDPLLGMSYVQFAIEGLKHQTSQGLGDISIPSGPRYAFYKLADSTIPNTKDSSGHEKDMFDGIDTSLSGLAESLNEKNAAAKIKQSESDIASAALADAENLANLVRPFLAALELLNADAGILGKNPYEKTAQLEIADKESQLRTAISLALNIELTASLTSPSAGDRHQDIPAISPTQKFSVKVSFHNGSPYALKLDALVLDGMVSDRGAAVDERSNEPPVAPGRDYEHTFNLTLPQTAYTKPGFHRADSLRDSVFIADQPQLITIPFAAVPPTIARARYDVPDLASAKGPAEWTTANLPETTSLITVPVPDAQGQIRKQQLAIVPAFSIAMEPGSQVVPASSTVPTKVDVKVTSNLDGAPSGVLRLQIPEGWKVSPLEQKVPAIRRGADRTFTFQISTPKFQQEEVKLNAVLDAEGRKYSEGYTLVGRDDIGYYYYYQPAIQHVSIVDVKVPNDLKVGYIMGAGDDIPNVLRQVGMNVTLLPAEKIASIDLSQFGTIVLGVRAYDTQKDLVANNQKLLDFVSHGGTLIVQNNNSTGDFNAGHFTPYSADLSRARVSVEEAPVQILAPDNPIFHYPNEISQKDFDGWVQERGLYFMSKWDDHFQPLLSCHDPGEPDQKGGMLEAKYGKGTYIYSGYAFFRQLPAGVPGAIRLFVNLVSAGHQQ